MATLKDGKAAEIAKTELDNQFNDAEVTKSSGIKSNKQIIAELLAKGCKRVSNIRVRSASVTPKDDYVMVSLSLEKPIAGYVADNEGVFHRSEVTIVFASSYSIASTLKDNDATAWAANQLVRNPKGLEVVLAGAKIDIVQQDVSEDEIYKNPFSSSNDEGTAIGHDTIINYVTKIDICNTAKQMLSMLAMNMMGSGGM